MKDCEHAWKDLTMWLFFFFFFLSRKVVHNLLQSTGPSAAVSASLHWGMLQRLGGRTGCWMHCRCSCPTPALLTRLQGLPGFPSSALPWRTGTLANETVTVGERWREICTYLHKFLERVDGVVCQPSKAADAALDEHGLILPWVRGSPHPGECHTASPGSQSNTLHPYLQLCGASATNTAPGLGEKGLEGEHKSPNPRVLVDWGWDLQLG